MAPLINFRQLIDMSFGPSDGGIVNVRYLYALLHGLVSQLELDSVRVELPVVDYNDAEKLLQNVEKSGRMEIAEHEVAKDPETGEVVKGCRFEPPDDEAKRLIVMEGGLERRGKNMAGVIVVDEMLNVRSQMEKPGFEERIETCEEEIDKIYEQIEVLNQEAGIGNVDKDGRGRDSCCSSDVVDGDENDYPNMADLDHLEDKLRKEFGASCTKLKDSMCCLQNKLCDAQKDIHELKEKFNFLQTCAEEDEQKFEETEKQIERQEKLIKELKCMLRDLLKDRDSCMLELQGVQEAIENLKTVKADQDDVDSALALKATIKELEAKVDHSLFEKARAELNEAILDAHQRLKDLNDDFKSKLADVEKILASKTDLNDFLLTSECFEDNLKALAGDIKYIASIRKREAAPFAKADLQCGCCNGPVSMRNEEPNVPKMPRWNSGAACRPRSRCCPTKAGQTLNPKKLASRNLKFCSAGRDAGGEPRGSSNRLQNVFTSKSFAQTESVATTTEN